MKTKLLLIIAILMSATSLYISLAGKTLPVFNHINASLFVNIYQNNDNKSPVVGIINSANMQNFNIIFCKKDDAWCKVINNKNGNIGWINITQLKIAQEEYKKEMFQKNTLKRLVAYQEAQDNKIIQLQTTIIQMQQELGVAFQRQQIQINQLKQFVS